MYRVINPNEYLNEPIKDQLLAMTSDELDYTKIDWKVAHKEV
jgi:hypothetical protein